MKPEVTGETITNEQIHCVRKAMLGVPRKTSYHRAILSDCGPALNGDKTCRSSVAIAYNKMSRDALMTSPEIRAAIEELRHATRPEQRTSYERALLALADLEASRALLALADLEASRDETAHLRQLQELDPIEQLVMDRLLAKLQVIRSELGSLKKTYDGSVSLRCQSLNDQCDLLEGILGVPQSYPRATQADR